MCVHVAAQVPLPASKSFLTRETLQRQSGLRFKSTTRVVDMCSVQLKDFGCVNGNIALHVINVLLCIYTCTSSHTCSEGEPPPSRVYCACAYSQCVHTFSLYLCVYVDVHMFKVHVHVLFPPCLPLSLPLPLPFLFPLFTHASFYM